MSEYSIYGPVRSHIIRMFMQGLAFDKKDRKRADFPKRVVQEFFEARPRMVQTIEARILAEELAWEDAGYPMYFPDSPELLDMLWRAKVDVRIEDLELDTFPRAFCFSWPKCKVEGVQPVGCMIWWGDGNSWKDAVIQFEKRYLRAGLYGNIHGIAPPDMRLGLHMSFCKEDVTAQQFGVKSSYYRASVPHDLFKVGLSSGKDFEATFKKYNGTGVDGVLSLNQEETHIQYVTFKLAVRMMIYMRACPEHVRTGYPEGKNRKAFEGRWDQFGPRIIGSPARLTSGTHDSPMAHLRTWYFRSYPIRKDLTRKTGVVFVRATMVNADVDPVTVEEGGKINGDVTRQ